MQRDSKEPKRGMETREMFSEDLKRKATPPCRPEGRGF